MRGGGKQLCAPTRATSTRVLVPGCATRRPAPPAAQRAGGAASVVLAVRQHQRHSLCCPLFGPLFGLPQGSLQPFAVVAPLAHADNRQQTKAKGSRPLIPPLARVPQAAGTREAAGSEGPRSSATRERLKERPSGVLCACSATYAPAAPHSAPPTSLLSPCPAASIPPLARAAWHALKNERTFSKGQT